MFVILLTTLIKVILYLYLIVDVLFLKHSGWMMYCFFSKYVAVSCFIVGMQVAIGTQKGTIYKPLVISPAIISVWVIKVGIAYTLEKCCFSVCCCSR